MNMWLFHQNGFARTTLSTTVSIFVEETTFLLHIGTTPGAQLPVQQNRIGQFTMHSACV